MTDDGFARDIEDGIEAAYVESMKPEQLQRFEDVVRVDPDRMSGAPCFKGTRIPVQMPIDPSGRRFSLDEFLETVPSLDRTQAQRFLSFR